MRSSDMSQTGIKQLLYNARNKGFAYSLQQMPARLGYRGFLVQDTRRTNEELLVGPETKKLQQLLLSTIPNSLLPSGNLREIGKEIASGKVKAVAVGKRTRRYAPPYDPASWNRVDPIVRKRVCNNCYHYANRRPTNTRAQPGYGGGQQYTQHTNQDLIAAAIRDGLVLRPYQPAGPNDPGPIPPNDHRHLVALAVDPGLLVTKASCVHASTEACLWQTCLNETCFPERGCNCVVHIGYQFQTRFTPGYM